MGFADTADDDATSGIKLLEGLTELCATLRVPSPAAYGIDEGKYTVLLDTMASQALASGSPGNNPLVPTSAQIVELYKAVYKGSPPSAYPVAA